MELELESGAAAKTEDKKVRRFRLDLEGRISQYLGFNDLNVTITFGNTTRVRVSPDENPESLLEAGFGCDFRHLPSRLTSSSGFESVPVHCQKDRSGRSTSDSCD